MIQERYKQTDFLKIKTMPKVSVIMPVYNGSKYLTEAIDSILRQTFNDFEFLIVDDGSSDNSLEIIRSYQDPRIRVIQNPQNLGISASLNNGIFAAQGEYIARMDCDDISLGDRFQKQIDFLDSHPEVIIVGSNMNIIGSLFNQKLRYPLTHDDIVNSMLTSNPMGHPSVMFRRVDVSKLGGYRSMKEWNKVSTEDYDLWLRMVAANYRLANLPECLMNYRIHANSLTQMAFANNQLFKGFNTCFYISGPDVFGCSSEELRLLRERKHPASMGLFIKIANYLSKNDQEVLEKRLRSKSFILAMLSLTSIFDVSSMLAIAKLILSSLSEIPVTERARNIKSLK